jgi:hypothetical protein
MKWTKAHSRNAVAAKARKRMADLVIESESGALFRPPRSHARFRLQIRDLKIGDSLTLSLTELPWRGRFFTSDGQELSTAGICRAIAAILNHE